MHGPLIQIEKATVKSLYEFAQQISLAANGEDDGVLSLRDECVMVKHSLSVLNIAVDKCVNAYKKDSSSQNLARLISLQETVRSAVQEVARVIKLATEVEAIKSSRFDSLQLLSLLEQIPALLTEIIHEQISEFINGMVDTVLAELSANSEIKKAVSRCHPCLNKEEAMREPAINELVRSITEELNSRLRDLRVVCNKDMGFGTSNTNSSANGLAVDPAIIQRQVLNMQNSVPSE